MPEGLIGTGYARLLGAQIPSRFFSDLQFDEEI